MTFRACGALTMSLKLSLLILIPFRKVQYLSISTFVKFESRENILGRYTFQEKHVERFVTGVQPAC